MGIATLLDPRFKHYMLLHCFEVLLGTIGSDCLYEVAKVKDYLSDLMSQYHSDEDEGNPSSSKATPVFNSGLLSSFSARVASTVPSAMRFRSELDRYLEDEMVDIHTKGFDVLDWWKVAGTRYPTLRMIARDIFTIPMTTVASESAFSTSGRVLSEHRSRLTSQLLEALMCSQDWICNRYKGMVTDEGRPASFWSVLREVQEGLQELTI
ncbi:zinc finger BED domain-containing protein DAYSLEEPER-like [Miscanthus floridulus]|uniref:zinc finger BED domain-containing protein DAYSLEEPER-like n=1 Tax=Miscanthus floridulus TaxID=154761 RepID=UPI003457C8B2